MKEKNKLPLTMEELLVETFGADWRQTVKPLKEKNPKN